MFLVRRSTRKEFDKLLKVIDDASFCTCWCQNVLKFGWAIILAKTHYPKF